MENEHSELIIGYLQGRLQGRSLDDFYAWVNESADNKKLFFETKALYEACAPSRDVSEIHDSWLRLLHKRKSRQRKRFTLLTRISTYAAVAIFAAAITSTVFLFFSREYDGWITSYVGGDGLEADVVVLPDGTRVSLGTRTPVMVNPNVSCNWKEKLILKSPKIKISHLLSIRKSNLSKRSEQSSTSLLIRPIHF